MLSKIIIAVNKKWNSPKPVSYGENTAQWEYDRIPERVKYWSGIVNFTGKRIFDLGCGWGGETIALSEIADQVIGVDIAFNSLQTAKEFAYKKDKKNVYFIQSSVSKLPFADCHFDLVYTNDVFEHLSDPALALKEAFRILKPGGELLVQFGPLFYSPFGYHMQWALTIPWIHLIVPLRIIAEIRNTYRQPPIKAKSWMDLGLNKITSRHFKNLAKDAGFEIKFYRELAVKSFNFLLVLPFIRNLFLFGIHAILFKPKNVRLKENSVCSILEHAAANGKKYSLSRLI